LSGHFRSILFPADFISVKSIQIVSRALPKRQWVSSSADSNKKRVEALRPPSPREIL